MKKLRRWGLFLLVNLIVIAVILEIGLRITLKDTFPPRFFEPHPTFGHFHRPNVEGTQVTDEYESYVKINSKGLRDEETPYEKPEGVFRILVIGDSFTEGLQVEQSETFPEQLEDILNETAPIPVEVINAGVSRYGTDNALLFLENEGLKYQPDLVIYAAYTNDLTDNLENELFVLRNGALIPQDIEVSWTEDARGVLYDTSYIYRIIYSSYLLIQQQNDETLIETDWGLVLPVYRATPQPREITALNVTGLLLKRMALSTQQANADLMVVYLPEAIQTETNLWTKVVSVNEPLSRDAPNSMFARVKPENAEFLDLSLPFRKYGHTTHFYYETDGHFNPAGHRLAAELIAPAILKELAASPKFSEPLADFYAEWLVNPEEAIEQVREDEIYWFNFLSEGNTLSIVVDTKFTQGVSIEDFEQQVAQIGGKTTLRHDRGDGVVVILPLENLLLLAELESVKTVYVDEQPIDFED